MASKSHDLTARVILQGQVDNTFTQLGTQLQSLGTQLLTLNRYVINFGKESLDAYTSYDDAMLAAYVAMQTKYTDAAKLESDYAKMRTDAMDKAAHSTRFGTLEVASAYATAMRAGLDYTEAERLVAGAIDFATANEMDLTDATTELIQVTRSSGRTFSETAELADQLTYAGNDATTTVEDMTAAMVTAGPSLRFFGGDTAAATAMVGLLSDAGITGSTAGIAMRNSMLRLIAPTAKATKAMGDLGYTEQETAEALEDAGAISDETMEALEKVGFSVYDSNGKLKPIITVWGELADALYAVDEAGNDVFTEQERNKILADIFPTRTFNSAKQFIDEYDKLFVKYNRIVENSAGYTAEAAETMESGYGGTVRSLEATEDALKTKVGGIIAEDIEPLIETLNSVLTKIYEMDDSTLAPLITFFETIIGGGAALVLAGTGMKMLGTALGAITGGKYLLAAVGVGALWTAVQNIAEAAKDDMFGDMTLSMSTFSETFTSIASAYDGKYADVEKYNEQISILIGNYESMSQTFSQGLWDMFINGAGMSDDDWKKSQQGAISALEGMDEAAKDAIKTEHDMVSSVVAVKAANDDTGLWGQVQEYIDAGYETMLADVDAKGIAVRKALLSGWKDGKLTDKEAALIYSTLDDYNQTLADYAEFKNQGKLMATLHDAQNVSADTVGEFYKTIMETRDASIALGEEEFWTELGMARVGGAPQEVIDAMFESRNAEILAKRMDYGRQMFDIFKLAMMSNYGVTNMTDLLQGDNAFEDSFIEDFVDSIGLETLKALSLVDNEAKAVLDRYTQNKNIEQAEYTVAAGGNSAAGAWARMTTSVKLEPETSELDKKIEALRSEEIRIPVFLDLPSDGSSGLYNPSGKNYKKGYAEGGRADVASIFGEAGPEWAIPEEHSSRTAELLKMAAAASGFTWGELLSRNGGLNAGSGGGSTVVYSPTIYANDASGVRDELIADKSRLEKWLRERELMQELVAYA